MIVPLWHGRPGTAPLTPAIWLSHTTLGYTVAHSAIDWGDEGQLFNTSEQQVLLSSWLFSCLIFVPPKKVSCLVTHARWFKPAGICLRSPRMPLTQPRQTRKVATRVRFSDVTLCWTIRKRVSSFTTFLHMEGASMRNTIQKDFVHHQAFLCLHQKACRWKEIPMFHIIKSHSLTWLRSISASILLPLLLLLVKQAW